jgi:hypothetical protein
METLWASVFDGDSDDWVRALPAYQRKVIDSMLAGREPVEVATAWLSASGPVHNAPLGAVRRASSLFYDNMLAEIHSLICATGADYAAERKDLASRAQVGKAAFIIYVSDAVAPHIGTTPVLLAPAVAITFAVLSRAGRDSVCTALTELIERRKAEAQQPPTS